MPELKSENTIISQQSMVTVGVLVLAIGATGFIVAGTSNANAKVEALTATTTAGLRGIETRLGKIEATVDKISPMAERLAVLESEMRRVQSTQAAK